MPKVSRRRRVGAPATVVWDLVSDPYHLPRWWPRTKRVENVRPATEYAGSQWTLVLETKGGRGVRADYRALVSREPEVYSFEQQIEGTPFERILQRSKITIGMIAVDGETDVSLLYEQRLKGFSRFGSIWMRRASRRILGEALDGLAAAVEPRAEAS